jgi:hypothetical protein
MKFLRCFKSIGSSICLGVLLAYPLKAETAASPGLPPLTVQGENFIDASGHPVRFWGVNVVALYPDHATADAFAANLASLQINLVRPHHILRPGKDWNPTMVSGALLSYQKNSREFDPDALDRFDYLNSAYRRNGIYVAFSAHWSRVFEPGDVDILPTTDQKDHDAWVAGMTELNGWDWRKVGDSYKNLPVFDERCALLMEEFNKKLLTHVNPYTGVSYASDPQVLTYEIINESSLEYSIICQNHFPDYFQAELEAKWNAYATAAGITPGDLYKPADAKTKAIRGQFLRKLDQDYFARMRAVIRGTGCKASITYSNLWRGDNASEMEAQNADHVEGHQYMDPLVAGGLNEGFIELTKSALVGKPYIIGEFNQAEGDSNIARQGPTRTMLPVAVSAYGSLQNWSGVVWFAWTHGGKTLGPDGWSLDEKRSASLGLMLNDGMMIDHLRTTGLIFRRGLVEKSTAPVTLWVDDPVAVGDYGGLMRGKYNYIPGWQDIHSIRKAFGPVPATQETAPWMTQTPPNPVVSDTGQIVKDTDRKQLTVTAPKAEAFSGYLDGKPLAGLKHLTLEGDKGFATVVLVADDDENIGTSSHLILSRTGLDEANADSTQPVVHLAGLKPASDDLHWYLQLTRPRADSAMIEALGGQSTLRLDPGADGSIELPRVDWHECELSLHK